MNIIDKNQKLDDEFTLYGVSLPSRLLIGTAGFPSPQIMMEAVEASKASIATVSIRRESARGKTGQRFLDCISQLDVQVLPNTAGCRTAKEAITTAKMAREIFNTNWVKLEVIGNDDTLQPDVFGLVDAVAELTKDGFYVLPYTTEDLSVAEKLLTAGCQVLMPWGSPIGTGRGLINPYALLTLRNYFPNTPLIIDAGIGAPSHAAQAMELGMDGVLLNTAVAKAGNPIEMARAFSDAMKAGRTAFRSGLIEARDMAQPSTPVAGTPFFDLENK